MAWLQVGKAYAARCSKAVNKKEAIALQEEGFQTVEAVFTKGVTLPQLRGRPFASAAQWRPGRHASAHASARSRGVGSVIGTWGIGEGYGNHVGCAGRA